uniref:Uncharacterized protein n=1 Tax=Peronospora matthiolae TaxID=2874970 RepID=A0AAV1V5G5_9STRA
MFHGNLARTKEATLTHTRAVEPSGATPRCTGQSLVQIRTIDLRSGVASCISTAPRAASYKGKKKKQTPPLISFCNLQQRRVTITSTSTTRQLESSLSAFNRPAATMKVLVFSIFSLSAALPASAGTPKYDEDLGCWPISVERDATYCIDGPVCSGEGSSPAGSSCPVKG